MTHGAHSDEPNDMAPRMGTDTRRPLLPSRRYSICGFFSVVVLMLAVVVVVAGAVDTVVDAGVTDVAVDVREDGL